jgi:hypothetical protein
MRTPPSDSGSQAGLARGAPRWRRAAAAVSLLSLVIVVAELYRSGVPWGPFHKPAIYPWAALFALAFAAWRSFRLGRVVYPVVFAALAFAVFLSNGRRINSGDTKPATLIPYALVRHGTLALDGLVTEPLPPWVEKRGAHVFSHYPVTAGLMALPVYLPAALGPGPDGGVPEEEKLAAALISAVSVGFVLATFQELGLALGAALLGTAIYACASSILSTASQALWQHGPGALALSAALYATVRSRSVPALATWAGLGAGLAVAARPTNAFAAAAIIAVLFHHGVRPLARALLAAAVPVALVGLYQFHAFGAPWSTGYGRLGGSFGSHPWAGLEGLLVSPTRGLVTFVPWTPLALFGLASRAGRERLFSLGLLAVLGSLTIHALWNDWTGGYCFGPRLVCDATPLLALGLAPLLEGPRLRRLTLVALVASALLSAGLAFLGAFRVDSPAAQAVYLGSGVHAMEWWRYPPLRLWRALVAR